MQRLSYGPNPYQYGELRLPAGRGPHAAMILIHGGGWQSGADLSYMRPMAEDLTRRGLATWLVEYRRTGETGGGWPTTLQDVLEAAGFLWENANALGIDSERILALGHSSGGQQAVWLARQRQVRLAGVVSLAGVLDMAEQWQLRQRRGESNHVDQFMGGGPAERPERYAAASPMGFPPFAVRQLLVHGLDDWRVEPSQSRQFAVRHGVADPLITLIELPGVDHVQIYDVTNPAWPTVAEAILELAHAPAIGKIKP